MTSSRIAPAVSAVLAALVLAPAAAPAATALADAPVLATVSVPPNVMMTLSVEWPTGTVAAYNDNASTVSGFECSGRDGGVGVCYFPARTYLGYFDAAKCYSYQLHATNPALDYFVPVALTATRDCSGSAGRFSGNYLNWATTHAIDGFRYAMTGGDRYIDTTTETVIEKAVHTGQGGFGQFPLKRIRTTAFTANGVTVPAVVPSTSLPADANWTNAFARVTVDGTQLGLGSARRGRVVQFANNTAFRQTLSLAQYRYVRVQLSGTNILNLAEVRVRNTGGTVVSRSSAGATASQSSTNGGRAASRAIDNNTDGVMANNSVTETNNELQPWWEVNLGSQQNLASVELWNRTDSNQGRLTNYYIFASNSPMTGRTFEELLRDATVWKTFETTQPNPSFLIAPGATDRATNLLNVRVRVCDSTVGLESNCRAYGSSNKPIGIIQENEANMRFGVMAYLNVDGTGTRGGVLRSPLKYVGPETIVPGGSPEDNDRKEINTDGTLVADPEDGVSGDIVSTGVINYLNKFGKTGSKTSLKSNDTVSEMFYEALRYIRGFGAATPDFNNFTGADTAAARDGFPAYQTWPENTLANIDGRPIQYSCQKTYFVGIGDTNAWCDSFGPGNTLGGVCGTAHDGGPTDPDGINVTTLGNQIGAAEGLGNLGTTWVSNSRGNTYHISSYAFWANVNDILVDDASKPWTVGRQTAQTYWVDVRETGSFNGTVAPKNQYWLAGKYGGFDTQGGNRTLPGTYDPLNNTYFTGERPDTLISSLRKVFDNIRDRAETSAAAGLTSNDITTTGGAFTVQYDSATWTGDVLGREISFDTSGALVVSDTRWNAAAKLETQAAGSGWETGRKIVSYNPTSARGVEFVYAAAPSDTTLSATQLGHLGSTATEREDQIRYIRGDRTNETGTSPKYRARDKLLGDIVDAKPVFVGGPGEDYSDQFNPGFSTFVTNRKTRTPVVYVAANDGMLHALHGDLASGTTNGGRELFAFIPSFAISGPSVPATPSVDGIVARSSPTYAHRHLMNATPAVTSVDFNRTVGMSGTSPDWRTLLVGGLGKGGKGFYALDITNPADWTSQNAVAGKVLWEFSHPDLGFSFGQPIIVKTAKHGWVVIVTSGYNNTTSTTVANRGRGYLFVLNARTGALLEQIGTSAAVGSESDPIGMAHATAFIVDRGDSTADAVYAGDLKGNLWRFDLRGSPSSYPSATRMAQLVDGDGNAQPITTKPRLAVYPDTIERWVFVGTGRLLDESDRANEQQQSFYAIRDGLQTRFYESGTLPGGVSFPVDRDNMVALSYEDLDNENPQRIYDDAKPMGWFLDFNGENDEGHTERVIFDPAVGNGIVTFATQYPNPDPCAPGVTSRIYAIDFYTGVSRLLDTTGESITYFQSDNVLLQPDITTNYGGNNGAGSTNIFKTDGGGGLGALGVKGSGAGVPVRLNWREVLE